MDGRIDVEMACVGATRGCTLLPGSSWSSMVSLKDDCKLDMWTDPQFSKFTTQVSTGIPHVTSKLSHLCRQSATHLKVRAVLFEGFWLLPYESVGQGLAYGSIHST